MSKKKFKTDRKTGLKVAQDKVSGNQFEKMIQHLELGTIIRLSLGQVDCERGAGLMAHFGRKAVEEGMSFISALAQQENDFYIYFLLHKDFEHIVYFKSALLRHLGCSIGKEQLDDVHVTWRDPHDSSHEIAGIMLSHAVIDKKLGGPLVAVVGIPQDETMN